ncbi:hypothetical protein [Agrobacterium rosae]|uniref:Uncharacterized protein n=1 Tax=Agrobacterium rosae TaxID=1972867 RepID=A0A1R3TNN4_9HYPH|nr:hypothetical protein [Agrobacterium rosae]SCX18188.1 hypothetical protein DSM25559_1691 [Agrobacterium rosae]
MNIKSVAPKPVDKPSYEPRPQKGPVDYEALGKLAIKRFPKVHAILAK